MKKAILYVTLVFCITFSALYTYKQWDRNVISFLQKNFDSVESYEYKLSLTDFPHLKINKGIIKLNGAISVIIASDIDVYHLKNGEFLLYLQNPQFQFQSPIYTVNHFKKLCKNLYIGVQLDENYKMLFKRFDMQDFRINDSIYAKNAIGKLNPNTLSLFSTPLMINAERNNFISLEIQHISALQYHIKIESSHVFEWFQYINAEQLLGEKKFKEIKDSIKSEKIFENFNYNKGQFLLKVDPSVW